MYQYDSLPIGDIRVLVLQPGTDDESLLGSLEPASLSETPEYSAISYCWGEPIFSETLQLPSGTLNITQSLAGALKRFRDPTKPVRLWADAVCINQSSIDERSLQVNQMGQIFRQAKEVLIWLGEAEAIYAMYFWVFYNVKDSHDIRQAGKATDDDQGPCSTFHEDLYERDRVEDFFPQWPGEGEIVACPCCNQLSPLRHSSWENALRSTAEFWIKPWFTRLWVAQEAALARHTTIFCGSHHIDSLHLWCAWRLIDYFGLVGTTQRHVDGAPEVKADLWYLIGLLVSQQQYARLLQTIMHTGALEAGLPHDRFFSIRDLCDAPDSLLPEVDYSMSIEDLWRRVTLFILGEGVGVLDNRNIAFAIGGLQRSSGKMPSLPSWAIDLDHLHKNFGSVSLKWDYLLSIHWQGYAGAPGSRLSPGPPPHYVNHNELCIKGLHVSTVSTILPNTSCPSQDFSRRPDRAFIDQFCVPWIKSCVSQFLRATGIDEPVVDSKVMFDLFWMKHEFYSNESEEVELQDLFAKLWRHCESGTKEKCSDQWSDEELLKLYWTMLDLHRMNKGYLLGITSDSCICWLPPSAIVGDCICVLSGTITPFVLRETGNGQHIIIEDAYVCGIMRGEAWPQSDEMLQDFILV